MNLKLPPLSCALCTGALDPLEPFFRATGDFLSPRDPLAKYANLPLHWSCYADWSERPRFAQSYVQAWVVANRRNPFWWTACADDQIFISVNPEPPVEEAAVRLMTVGSDIRVPLVQWKEWLRDPQSITPNLQPVEVETLQTLLPRLRERFPDDHAVVQAIDPEEKTRSAHGGARQRRTASTEDEP